MTNPFVIDPEEEERRLWLEWRRGGVCASDIAILLGVAPSSWSSAYALWADKLGIAEDEDVNEAMEFGKESEPMLMRYFHKRTGLHCVQPQAQVERDGWMRATLDGYCMESAEGSEPLGIVELKTTQDAPDEWESEIPLYYQCQVQWQMHVTGTRHAWLGVLHMNFGRPTFRVYEVEYDEADATFLEKRAAEFWEKVKTQNPPTVDGEEATTRTLKHLYPGSGIGEPLSKTQISRDLVALYESTGESIKALSVLKEQYANQIRDALKDADVGEDAEGIQLITYKRQGRTGFDKDRALAEMPELKKYITKGEHRVLRVSAPPKDVKVAKKV